MMKQYFSSPIKVLAQFEGGQEIPVVLWMVEDDNPPVGLLFEEGDPHLYPVSNDVDFLQYVYGDEQPPNKACSG